MKRYSLSVLFGLLVGNLVAQTPQNVPNDTINKIEQKSDEIFDNSQETPIYIREETTTLKDHPKAESYDKKWLKENSVNFNLLIFFSTYIINPWFLLHRCHQFNKSYDVVGLSFICPQSTYFQCEGRHPLVKTFKNLMSPSCTIHPIHPCL